MDYRTTGPQDDTTKKVDEDEGSCLRRQVNRIAILRIATLQAASLRTGKIERSAEALRVRHHPPSTPPTRDAAYDNAARATGWTKRQQVAMKIAN
jgi:hypothetical protein